MADKKKGDLNKDQQEEDEEEMIVRRPQPQTKKSQQMIGKSQRNASKFKRHSKKVRPIITDGKNRLFARDAFRCVMLAPASGEVKDAISKCVNNFVREFTRKLCAAKQHCKKSVVKPEDVRFVADSMGFHSQYMGSEIDV
jgi:histone H3/H4